MVKKNQLDNLMKLIILFCPNLASVLGYAFTLNSIISFLLYLLLASVDGCLYTWGRGFSGTPDVQFPQGLPSSLWFTVVAVGWNHALALTGKYIHFHF